MYPNICHRGIFFPQVSLELATHNKDFSTEQSKSKLARRNASPSQTAPSPQRESSSRSHHADIEREELPAGSFEEPTLNAWSPQKHSKEPSPHLGLRTSRRSQLQVEEDPEVLLHTLLMVPDGKNLPMQAPNVYLNCKLWCDETARSVVSWGQANPSFNFVQVSPGNQVF